jgi:cyanate permease
MTQAATTFGFDPPHASSFRWTMLGLLWFAYFCFGMVSGAIAPLAMQIGAELGLGRSSLGVVMGAWALVYIGAAMPAGAAVDRFGTRLGIAVGVLVIALSGLARAAAADFWTLFASIALFGLGGPLVSVGAPKVISQWFSGDERGTAMGIYMTGPYLGMAFAFVTANGVLMPLFDGSWRMTLAVYGLIAVAAAMLWLLFAREPAPGSVGAAERAPAGFRAFAPLLRQDVVRIILVVTLAAFMFNHGMMAWLPSILTARGLDPASAGVWASIPTLIGVVSALVIPRFATPARGVDILAALYVCLVVATVLLAFTDGAGLLLGLVLLGIARIVGAITLMMLMDAPRVGSGNMGTASGLYFTVGEIGGVLGPTMLGIVADVGGGFSASILTLNVLALFLLGMTVPLRRARRRTLAAT